MIGHVVFKPGAKVVELASAGVRILGAIDAAAHASGVAITITSGSEDRGRTPSDAHMTGEAFDVSVKDFNPRQTVAIYRFIRHYLGDAFTGLYEVPKRPTASGPSDDDDIDAHLLRSIAYVNPSATAPHFHIQRTKATTWPPEEPPKPIGGARPA
jgi:hypothetical protein